MRHKKININIVSILCLSLLLTGCGKKDTTNTTEIKLAENQSMVLCQVSEITGNDMKVALVKESTSSGKSNSSDNKDSSSKDNASDKDDSSSSDSSDGFPGGDFDPSNLPEDFDPSNMPQGGSDFDPSNMPQGGGGDFDPDNMPQGGGGDFDPGNRPQGGVSESSSKGSSNKGSSDNSNRGGENSDSASSSKGDTSKNSKTNFTRYKQTGETKEYRIPVGTTVTTKLGTQTSFSRIAASDVLKLITEKDDDGNEVIVAIYMVN